MRFRDKKSGAIYVVTSDDVLSMFKNDRYEVVDEKKNDVKVEEPKETFEVEETIEVNETEEVKEVKKSKKK